MALSNPSAILDPKPATILDLTMSDAAIIRVRRYGNATAPRLILSHGNGFAIDAYFPFWGRLLADFDVIVYDQRNHGWNTRHTSGHTQQQMADDLEAILHAVAVEFGKRPTAGAFHSLSTTVSLLHALKYGMRWDALILFDPPLAPPPGHRLHSRALQFETALHDWALTRQRHFESADELAAYFKSTRRMRRWVPGAAELMARSIARPSPGGGVELTCPPEFEADIYLQNSKAPAWSVLPQVASQIFVVSSDFKSADVDPPGQVSEALQADFGIEVVAVPNTGHLLQIERPGAVEMVVRDHLKRRGFGQAATG